MKSRIAAINALKSLVISAPIANCARTLHLMLLAVGSSRPVQPSGWTRPASLTRLWPPNTLCEASLVESSCWTKRLPRSTSSWVSWSPKQHLGHLPASAWGLRQPQPFWSPLGTIRCGFLQKPRWLASSELFRFPPRPPRPIGTAYIRRSATSQPGTARCCRHQAAVLPENAKLHGQTNSRRSL